MHRSAERPLFFCLNLAYMSVYCTPDHVEGMLKGTDMAAESTHDLIAELAEQIAALKERVASLELDADKPAKKSK